MVIPISPRLENICRHSHGKKVADIGTDHAYVPIELIGRKYADFIIASDIKRGPLDVAMQNINKYGLSDKFELRRGYGLSVLEKDEADVIIISGIGGILMINILNSGKERIGNSKLVLQPMNCQYELRHYLLNNGFIITGEDISVEGTKVYNLLTVKPGTEKAFERDIYYHIPPYLAKNRNFGKLYAKKEREFLKVIRGLERANSKNTEKLNQYKFWLNELKKNF